MIKLAGPATEPLQQGELLPWASLLSLVKLLLEVPGWERAKLLRTFLQYMSGGDPDFCFWRLAEKM